MKRHLVLTFVIFIAWMLLLPVNLQSQVLSKEFLFRVNVPFDFVVADVHLPTGSYSVFHVLTPDLILLENDNNRASAFVLVRVSSGGLEQYQTQLVFSKYGDNYFLSQIRSASDRQIHTCSKCRQEEALAARGSQAETRIVALK